MQSIAIIVSANNQLFSQISLQTDMQRWNTSFPMGIVYWCRSAGVMSGPGDIRLLWESRALSCATVASWWGGGGARDIARGWKVSLALVVDVFSD